MKQKETSFKEKVLVDLRSLKKTWAEKIQQVAIRGTPDILACVNGFFVALELKREGEEPDALQGYKLAQIEDAEGFAFAVTPSEWPKVLKYLKKLSLITGEEK